MADLRVADQLIEIEQRIIGGLKDFQRATVERIDELFRAGRKRVLVSDEVGLGKTLIARGTVAKFARMRKERDNDPLVKIVYICSNAAIAEQNLSKLRISSQLKTESIGSSRLSMQHINIFYQENDAEVLNRYIQLIPLTPDTSFRMSSVRGTYSERALIFAVLARLEDERIIDNLSTIEQFMREGAEHGWDSWAKKYYADQVEDCNNKTKGKYLDFMRARVIEELEKDYRGEGTTIDLLVRLCDEQRANPNRKVDSRAVIGRLRMIFAQISLEKLDPDLVIMDEFQRFKYLIQSDENSETGMLAHKFFNSDDVWMLLLSATPYKMYSTLEEIDEAQVDEHYSEFLGVMDFLNVGEEAKFREVWSNYSIHLKEMASGNTAFLEVKRKAEEAMYQNVCRTERISAKIDMINDCEATKTLNVSEADIKSYLQFQKLLSQMGVSYNVPVDYVKSCPYLLSFMKEYQLKKNIERYFKEHPTEYSKTFKDTFWLNKSTIEKYEKVPNNNARLEKVMSLIFNKDTAEQLLWIPPTKPYYPPQGVFEKSTDFTKTLVFSSWEMVPRMLAGLISYEAERRTVGKLLRQNNRELHYFTKAGERRYPSARLNFSMSGNEPKSMSLFCLIYPSLFLTNCYNPIQHLNNKSTLKEIEKHLREVISNKVADLPSAESGIVDKSWYYIAPMLLDGTEYVQEWLDTLVEAGDVTDVEGETKSKGYNEHLKALRSLYEQVLSGATVLGRKPDDLVDVLVDMAIAAPAVVINRTYCSYAISGSSFKSSLPTQIARLFINKMNTPESTAVIELACGRKSDDAYWQDVLTYSKQGNIQAMFDEFAHLITNGLDKDKNLVQNLHEVIAESMSVKSTTLYLVDTYPAFKARIYDGKDKQIALRSHFAVAFTKGEGDKDTDRKRSIRNSFNSPFRPFVLASTSIGQEGLDFHNYCRRIVHWNLPSNPIDLEQREGRINRFECLAIRQNVAKRYGDIGFTSSVWQEMFQEAERRENDGVGSELIPFWGLTPSDDMVKIERIVPMYPMSRDVAAYERLIKILSLYRLTLGQARQEEILNYIFQNCDNLDDLEDLFINLSPYYKKGN